MTGAPSEGLSGGRVVITGSTGTIGRATARVLAERGVSLALVARNRSSLDVLLRDLPGGPHDAIAMDVVDEDAWDRERENLRGGGRFVGIVAAAAVLGPIGTVGTWRVEAFKRTFDVNVVGTLHAIIAMREALVDDAGSVVTFSGGGATGPLPRFDAYASSKAALVRLTENIAIDLAPSGVRVNAIAPGFVVSAMHNDTLAAGPDSAGADYYLRTRRAVEDGTGDAPDLAAKLAAYLLSSESAGVTGRLLSARWDPWEQPEFRERLREDPNLATLRRIDDQYFESVTRGVQQ